MSAPLRITFLQTHPIQYMAPWFRYITQRCPEIALQVLYASTPTAAQQGTGFGEPFEWDESLTSGYANTILTSAAPDHRFDDSLRGSVDVLDAADRIRATRPDVVVIPGWHSHFYRRALDECRRASIPTLYRGDSSFVSAPAGIRRLAWYVHTRRRLRQYSGYLSVGSVTDEYLRHFGVHPALLFRSPAAVDNACFAAASRQLRAGCRARRRTELGAGADDFLILFAGKFTPRKRPLDAIAAAARLGKDVVLALAGSGTLLEDAKSEADRLGVRVTWCGFLNQSAMRATLAAADCVVVPSLWETWGLIVNEALASGTPCVVSDQVAAHADLIHPQSGAIHSPADIDGLTRGLLTVRQRIETGVVTPETCRAAVAGHSFEAATQGLAAAAGRVIKMGRLKPTPTTAATRVMAACGHMVMISGGERMTFEVLRTLRERGAAIHCVVNGWGSAAVVDEIDRLPATWSSGRYLHRVGKRPLEWPLLAWDILRTSTSFVRDAARFRPTHVLVPEFTIAIRLAPALWWLKQNGARIILRLGTPPEPGRRNHVAWSRIVEPVVTRYAPNSQFIERELLAHGIDGSKSGVIRNTVPTRTHTPRAEAKTPGRIIYVGQVIPPKGVMELLDALAILRERRVPATLDIVGDMEEWAAPGFEGYRERVRARAESPDLAPYVRILGRRDDVPALMAAASLHCLPSWPQGREGFAVVTLEAKQAGIPSVVTPSGALAETVTHEQDGWVCRDGSPEAIAEGLEHFLTDPCRLARASRCAAESGLSYSRERFSQAWGEMFGAS